MDLLKGAIGSAIADIFIGAADPISALCAISGKVPCCPTRFDTLPILHGFKTDEIEASAASRGTWIIDECTAFRDTAEWDR